MKSILILGGTSDMAQALALAYSTNKWKVLLAGRNLERLNLIKNDLEIRSRGKIETLWFDALNFDTHQQTIESLSTLPDITVCVFGYLGDQQVAKTNWKEAFKIISTNYTGAVSVLNVVSEAYKRAGKGTIVGISSVAGDRGRQSNYTYGSAKAAFSAYLSGLRSEMFKHGLHVITVKPGFVYTKMTENLDLPAVLTANPDQVAKGIVKAIRKKKNIIYILPIWRLIMFVIRNIPEYIFKRLKL